MQTKKMCVYTKIRPVVLLQWMQFLVVTEGRPDRVTWKCSAKPGSQAKLVWRSWNDNVGIVSYYS